MIIDSHTHVQRTSGFWDSPPERIVELIDKAGIDMAVIMTYSDSPDLIDYIHKSVERFPQKLIGYTRLDPSMGESACSLLEHSVVNLGMKGLKLHPVGNLVHPADETSINLIKTAARLGVPTLFHCGDEELTLPLQVASAAKKCPSATIILGHMGGYFHVEDAIIAALTHPNIYLETSAMPYPWKIKDAVDTIGEDRVLFASDGPGCPPDLELKKVKMAGLTQHQEEKVIGGNIRRILSI
ncbi:MAG: amidohydrolase family protein [Candidatus Eremiobacteraeota bacterium]|nr:amidohydrolase family protein [Candidatus Eremiobacteraeota bacterium]